MKPYQTWKKIAEAEMNHEQYAQFWKEYLSEEEKIYKKILKLEPQVKGTLTELAAKFGIDEVTFTGFLDGINNSLVESLDLESLETDTEIDFTIDYETLYYNMHDAKAKWLYTITEWDTLLTKEKKKEIVKKYRESIIIVKKDKIGRNEPCPCGSGKKYKKCCLLKENQ